MTDLKYWWEKSFSWDDYKEMIQSLLDEGKTTGEVQSEEMYHYGKMNWQRSKRIEKTFKVDEPLDELLRSDAVQPMKVIVITEGWCGDAAQSGPVMAELARLYPDKIEIKVILRDTDTALIDQFLTNGGRSIPKFIFLDRDFKLLGDWGPRPQEVQALYMKMREQELPYSEISEEVQKWYAKDKTHSVQQELADLIKTF
ncbi:MAG TPA: thioredoxin family protein [Chitinophagales bacterium]|nr:thioredoxin family protein [Chitinophagales bacterium]